MDRPLRSRVGRAAAALTIAAVMAGCGSSDSNPTSIRPGVPFLSNLVLALLAQSCTVGGGPGRVLPVSFDYTDSDGNLRGGVVQTTGRFEPSGGSTDVNFNIPSQATITGTTSGNITVQECVRFGTQTAIVVSVAVVDAAGNSSNVLSARLNRPAGVPQTIPSDGEGGAFGR